MSPQLLRLRFPVRGLLFAPCHLLLSQAFARSGDTCRPRQPALLHSTLFQINDLNRASVSPRRQAIGAESRIAERGSPASPSHFRPGKRQMANSLPNSGAAMRISGGILEALILLGGFGSPGPAQT